MYSVRMKKINLYVPEPLLASLQKLAAEKGLSLSEVIRRALDHYVERQEKNS